MSAHHEDNPAITGQPIAQEAIQPIAQQDVVVNTQGGWRASLSTCLRTITPCLEVLLAVGSEAAQNAIQERLANNTHLTQEQKNIIAQTTSVVISNQGHTTVKAINALVDGATTRVVLEGLAKDTAKVVADASEALLEVGKKEAQDAIIARLDGNNTLSPQQKEQIVKAVSVAISNQGHITIKALNQIVDGTTAHAALMSLGQGTISNISSASQAFIDLSSDIAQSKLRESLESSFSSIDTALRTVMIDGIMRTVMADMKLTQDELDKLVAMHVTLAPDLQSHFNVPGVLSGNDMTYDNHDTALVGVAEVVSTA